MTAAPTPMDDVNDAFHELARRELGRHPAPPRDHAGDALRAGHAARGRRRARRTRLTEAVLSVVPALAPLLRRGRPDQPDDRPTQGILPGEEAPRRFPDAGSATTRRTSWHSRRRARTAWSRRRT
ncbi:hypothetical protein ACFQX7_06825 [Luedemannella flava]